MSKGPSWLDKASKNTTGNKVAENESRKQKEIALIESRKKPGRKKAIVPRKQVMMSLSEEQLKKIDRLESELKLDEVSITRGRSEVVEIAINVLGEMLSKNATKPQILSMVKNVCGLEDRLKSKIGD